MFSQRFSVTYFWVNKRAEFCQLGMSLHVLQEIYSYLRTTTWLFIFPFSFRLIFSLFYSNHSWEGGGCLVTTFQILPQGIAEFFFHIWCNLK